MNDNKPILLKPVFLLITLALLLSMGISACGTAEMDVTVYSRDRFEMNIIFQIPNDMLQMMGGTAEIEAQLDEMVREGREEGFRIRWREIRADNANSTAYEIIFPRSDIGEATEADIFTWREVRHNNRNAYRIDFVGVSEFSSFMSFTLNLHAGRILDTNGNQINSRTVTWVNPTRTPYAIVVPRGTVRWIPLVLGILTILALGAGVVLLLVTGLFTKWGSAGLNTGKWKLQETKLKGQEKKISKEKEGLVTELGRKAWQAKVLHSLYSEKYFDLESLDGQKQKNQEQIDELSNELARTKESRTKISSDYSKQLNELQAQQKEIGMTLNKSRSEQTALKQEDSKIQHNRQRAQSELKTYQEKLIEVQASDLPDKESRVASINNAINSIEGTLQAMSARAPEIEARLSTLEVEQKPLEDQVNRLTDQIATVQKELKEALMPLDQRIAEIEQEIKAKRIEIDQLRQKMLPIIDSLGPLVNSARPDSDSLEATYEKIDQIDSNLVSVSQEHDLVSKRLKTSDKGAVRNFYIMVAGILVMIVFAVIFLIIAFV